MTGGSGVTTAWLRMTDDPHTTRRVGTDPRLDSGHVAADVERLLQLVLSQLPGDRCPLGRCHEAGVLR